MLLQGCYSGVIVRVFQESNRSDTWVLQESNKGISGVLQGCYKGASRVLQGFSRDYLDSMSTETGVCVHISKTRSRTKRAHARL